MNAFNSTARVANDVRPVNPTAAMSLTDCAKAIRAEFKAAGIKGSVKCSRGYAINVKVDAGSMLAARQIARRYHDISYDAATGESLCGGRYVFVEPSAERVNRAAEYILADCQAAIAESATVPAGDTVAVGSTPPRLSRDSRGDAEVFSSEFECAPHNVWARDNTAARNVAHVIARHLIGLT